MKYEDLLTHLQEKYNFRTLWVIDEKDVAVQTTQVAEMRAALLNGHIVILQKYRENNGWEIFIPACDSIQIPDNLAALDNYVSGVRAQALKLTRELTGKK